MLYKRCEHKGRDRNDCNHPWWAQIKHTPQGATKTQKVQVSLEKYSGEAVRGRGSKSRASDLEADLRKDVKSGRYLEKRHAQAAPHAETTVSKFLDSYIKEHMEAKKLASYESSEKWKIARVRKRWGKRRIRDIRQLDVLNFLNDVRKGGAGPATVRRYFARIRHMLNWAERYEFIEKNPIRRGAIELEPEHNERSRRPTAEELTAIFKAADPFLSDYLEVKLDTGLRRGSMLKLQFKHIDEKQGKHGALVMPPRLLKQRKGQILPLTLRAKTVLARRWASLSGSSLGREAFVFGDESGNAFKSVTPLVKRWYAALKTAGIKDREKGIDLDLHEHDLRGECASRLNELGMSLSTIQQWLAHSSLAMTQRYLRARVGELDDAAAALDSLGSLRAGPTVGPTVDKQGPEQQNMESASSGLFTG